MHKGLWERKSKVGWGQNMEGLAAPGQGEPLNSQSFPLSSPPVQIFLILQRAAQGHFLQEACANLSRRALSSAEVICPYRDLHSLDTEVFLHPSLAGLSGTGVQCLCPLGDEGMLTLRGLPSHSLPQEAFLAPQLCPSSFSHFLPPLALSARILVYASFSSTRACAP